MAARRGPGGRFLPRGASVDRYGRLRWRDSRGRFLPGWAQQKLSDIYLGRLRPGDPGYRSAWTYYEMYRAYKTGKWSRQTLHGEAEISDKFEKFWRDVAELNPDFFNPSRTPWVTTARFMQDPDEATLEGGSGFPPPMGNEVVGCRAIAPHVPTRLFLPKGYAVLERDWVARPPRVPKVLIHLTRREVYCESRERYLQTVPWEAWSQGGTWTPHQLGEALAVVGRLWGIRPSTPGATAWRIFQTYMTGKLPVIPEAMMTSCHECRVDYVIIGPRVREAVVWRYDMLCAYGGWLALLPDLSRGEWVWQETDRMETVYGLYRCQRWNPESRRYAEPVWIPGSALAWGRGVPYYDGRRAEITGVWRWAGEVSGYSPFERFVHDCLHTYDGLPEYVIKLLRRIPVFLVGKSIQRSWRTPWPGPEGTRILDTSRYYYPFIWLHVVGGLQAYMHRVMAAMGEAVSYAYIDTVHTTCPLPQDLLESSPLGWRLEEGPVPVRYQAVGRWESPTVRKHQGTPD